MKPLKTMSDDEQIEFATGALRIIDVTNKFRKTAPQARLAAIALWCICYERPPANMATHYEVDPTSFIDEVVRAGTLFFENLQAMMTDPPPSIPPEALEFMYGRTVEHIRTLRDPRYRKFIIEVFEGYLQDLKERGEL
jgi:hypothetical protein